MPHLSFECSANMAERLDVAALCVVLREPAVETGIFPKAGIRVRAIRADHVVIGDGHPQHAFLDLTIRLSAGPSAPENARAAEQISGALRGFCALVLAESSLMLSMEMRDIDADLSPKDSPIRKYLVPDYLD